jgi:tRNA U34 5-carboxymethylaminomethyl modifying enzyme MnmG/GidA
MKTKESLQNSQMEHISYKDEIMKMIEGIENRRVLRIIYVMVYDVVKKYEKRT